MSVLVAGAGPAGLLVAAELALAGVGVRVVDRLPARSAFCRGFTLNARSLELLDRRGLAGRFLAEGPTVPFTMFADPSRPLDLTTLASDHPYVLGIPQTRTEELLEQWLAELGVPVEWGHEVVGLRAGDTGVDVTLAPGGTVRADYLVGCDGSRSTVRKLAGIGFPGTDATRFGLLADVELADPEALPFGMTTGVDGTVFAIPRPGYLRVVIDEPHPPEDRDTPVTLDYFQRQLDRVLGYRVELRAPRWLSRFSDAARQADRYVAGRVMLAGDAAHVHPPAGAVGVNVALADAMNLGWKLAATVRGHAPAGLLGTYDDERRSSGAVVLRTTRAQSVLGDPDPRLDPVRELLAELAALPQVNDYLVELVTGVGTRYDMGVPGEHPWLGRLVPDLGLVVDGEPTSLARLLRPGRPVLLWFAERPPRVPGTVVLCRAECPVHPGIEGILVRPDGFAAWISTAADPQPQSTLDAALATWCAPPPSLAG
ncbi:FAD-dependent monooxygenase [Amycolatopsis suaedae]|uniref:FAD-binding domain-containing protein n=1 Tax=Amycolatopsis suaedae TaxID=2510978 RepID=A0A4Q7J8W2_9PSEU|nr:FAD-dependent monooxygenase [Amycolatopsis suaedae]RZQ64161.1 hypothetical protein EWH70_09200 [Amycolatopsis suaedae]